MIASYSTAGNRPGESVHTLANARRNAVWNGSKLIGQRAASVSRTDKLRPRAPPSWRPSTAKKTLAAIAHARLDEAPLAAS